MCWISSKLYTWLSSLGSLLSGCQTSFTSSQENILKSYIELFAIMRILVVYTLASLSIACDPIWLRRAACVRWGRPLTSYNLQRAKCQHVNMSCKMKRCMIGLRLLLTSNISHVRAFHLWQNQCPRMTLRLERHLRALNSKFHAIFQL